MGNGGAGLFRLQAGVAADRPVLSRLGPELFLAEHGHRLVRDEVAERLLDTVGKLELIVAVLVYDEIEEAIQLGSHHQGSDGRSGLADCLHFAEKYVGAPGERAAIVLRAGITPSNRRVLV